MTLPPGELRVLGPKLMCKVIGLGPGVTLQLRDDGLFELVCGHCRATCVFAKGNTAPLVVDHCNGCVVPWAAAARWN